MIRFELEDKDDIGQLDVLKDNDQQAKAENLNSSIDTLLAEPGGQTGRVIGQGLCLADDQSSARS